MAWETDNNESKLHCHFSMNCTQELLVYKFLQVSSQKRKPNKQPTPVIEDEDEDLS